METNRLSWLFPSPVTMSALPIFSLDDRVAIITGGSRGIGFEIARTMAESGAKVVIADRLRAEGEAAADQLRGQFVEADVTSSASMRTLAEQVAREHGRIDILATIAGVALNTPAEETTDEDWRRLMSINLDGLFYGCREVGRFMLAQGKGVIVNMASMSGMIANRPQPQAAYNASKAGVILLTKSLAGEWAGRGVRVNAIAPGYVGTPMTKLGLETPEWRETWLSATPMGRLAEPAEIAPLAVFLASDASSYMTGSTVVIDGGYTAW